MIEVENLEPGKLPDKSVVNLWECDLVVLKLMHDFKWPRHVAQQWLTDFLRWLYTARRYRTLHNQSFAMDGMSHLDDVWHTYILCTKEYFKMSRELFSTSYIHHGPENPFNRKELDSATFESQLLALLDDWGEAYLERVYAFAADRSDLLDIT